jgi:hypothetical protein
MYCHILFENLTLRNTGVAAIAQVRASAMFLLAIVGNWQLLSSGDLYWHNIRTEFHESHQIGSNTEMGNTQRQQGDLLFIHFLLSKGKITSPRQEVNYLDHRNCY